MPTDQPLPSPLHSPLDDSVGSSTSSIRTHASRSDSTQVTTPTSEPSSSRLTKQSLKPLKGRTSNRGLAASSSSSNSEANDLVSPLRNSITRPLGQTQSPRLPYPSPQAAAMGLSELLAGPSDDYFSQPIAGVTRRQSWRQSTPASSAQSSSSATPLAPGYPARGPRSAQSDRSSSSRGKMSPKIQNTDGILAPHGSFTSARRITPQTGASASLSDTNVIVGQARRQIAIDNMNKSERQALERAARSGDQLASYSLGWSGAETPHNRHMIGESESVWGPPSPGSALIRSSVSSESGSVSRPASRNEGEDMWNNLASLALEANAASRRRPP